MHAPFGRVLTAMITPFTAEGALDVERVWELARHLVATGSDGVVVAGTTGESPTLSADEKVVLFRTVVEAVGTKGVVLAGTGTYDTAESVHLAKQAEAAGVHGLMAVTPYYSRPSQEGLVAHFTAIADASALPLLVYNIPSRTGRLIEVPTLARLAEHPRIVAVKDAVGDLAFTTKTIKACGDSLAVYSGDDILTLPMMAVGGVGIVSVASHLAGRQIAAMVAAAAEGKWDEARRLHLALTPLFEACFLEPNPMPVKAAMNALWKPVGQPRLPLVAASDKTLAAVREALASADAAG
ncbi:MAG TPA: 4-hydroxy-tetrahydrodipicolinate synthase [Acidimicrobiia bacterium]|nr:4-hydroxy-tetrahydrodipicolinate synthase [Acidimicrobiia bacterium]